jgi:hypothetical protein
LIQRRTEYPMLMILSWISILITPLDLLIRRDVHDVVHKVVAVGSRSLNKAQEFIKNSAGGDLSINAYGTYDEVYADKVGRPNRDIVP